MRLTEGEQNRLIQENMALPEIIAARYRGKKNIPFEDLVAEGTAALVKSARRCSSRKTFPAFAESTIKYAIIDFINAWQEFEPLDAHSPDGEKLIYEWQNFLFALYERWKGDPYSPESLLIKYQEVSKAPELVAAAFIGLSPFERKLIEEYFIRRPTKALDQVARDNRLSYKRANETIYRALGKMRQTIINIEIKKRQESNVVVFPARAGRRNKSDRPNNRRVNASTAGTRGNYHPD